MSYPHKDKSHRIFFEGQLSYLIMGINVKMRKRNTQTHRYGDLLSVPSFLKSIKVKVKVTLVQALRLCTGRTAHRGSRGIALLYRH
jgi:hypothetical protein